MYDIIVDFSRGVMIFFLSYWLYCSLENERYKNLDFDDYDTDDDDKVLVKYEDKYLLELENMEVKPVDKDNLLNCFVVDTTPVGNVLMNYNDKKETFDYFSDMTIPYRYLEVVCRKFVIQFDCASLYVKPQIKEAVILEKKQLTLASEPQKKSVFAKFKNYNSDSKVPLAGPGPPKNSIPQNNTSQPSGPLLLKDNINRFSHQGKFNNFSILKKIDKKLIDKKYAMTFADFKKLKNL